MSHSYRHTPIIGICAESDKDDKRAEKGKLRAALRNALSIGDWERASYDIRDDVWNWAKDGKQWVGDILANPSHVAHPNTVKALRK